MIAAALSARGITHALIVWTAFLAVLVLHHLGACPTHAPFH